MGEVESRQEFIGTCVGGGGFQAEESGEHEQILAPAQDLIDGRALPDQTDPAAHFTTTVDVDMIAELLWEEYRRHPWLLEGQRHQPWIGPGISARYEWGLTAVEGCGLGDIAIGHLISLIETHTAGNAANDIQAVDLASEFGISDVDWWNIHGPLLEQVIPAEKFPISGRVGSTVGMEYQAITSHRAIFGFGLGVILDGVEKQLTAGN